MKKIEILATMAALPLALSACGEKATDATAESTEAAMATEETAPMDAPTAEGTASNDQGGNDQGGNDQGGNDQGGNDQGGNDQGGTEQ